MADLMKRWAMGQQDQGHGHYNYAVLEEDSTVVLEVGNDARLAHHLVYLHNKTLDAYIHNETSRTKQGEERVGNSSDPG